MSTAPTVLASFDPDSFMSGGLADDFDATIVDARAEFFTYPGSDTEVTAIKITYEELNNEKTQHEQYYSFGKPDQWQPNGSDEGLTMLKVGNSEAPNNNTNFAFFLTNLKKLGFPGDRMSAKLSWMIGITGHWTRIAAPKRAGLEAPPERAGKGVPTILVLTKKLKWPWEGGMSAAGAARTATRTAAAPTTTGRTRSQAVGGTPTTSQAPAIESTPVSASNSATPSSLDQGDYDAILTQLREICPEGTPVKLSIAKLGVFKALKASGLEAGSCNIATAAITPAFLVDNGYMVDGEGNDTTVTRIL